MTPEDKASQLLRRFTLDFTMDFDTSRQASIIAVEEIIESLKLVKSTTALAFVYWYTAVKKELENL